MLMPGTAVSVGYHFYTRLMDDLKMLPLCPSLLSPSQCLPCLSQVVQSGTGQSSKKKALGIYSKPKVQLSTIQSE